MASSGWLGEQVIYGHLGLWPHTDWIGNLYISSIRRNTNSVDVNCVVRMFVRSDSGWGGGWYMNRIDAVVAGQRKTIKPNTAQGQVIEGVNYDVSFSFTIGGLSPTATSANISVYYDDVQGGIGWVDSTKTWTIYFEKAEQPPALNCGNTWSNNPSVWRVKSGISGIDWGVGYNSRTLTADVSYTFQGTSYSYRAGTWTDGATSKEIDINKYSATQPWVNGLPAGANVTIKWTATTNIGSTSCSTTTFSKAPATPVIPTITTSNPAVYRLASTVSGINWGDYYKSTSLYAKVTGSIDGNTISWTTMPITTGTTSGSFDYNALVNYPSAPWLKVPDDETVTVTWYATINVGYGNITGVISKTQYCQKSYTAYVIEQGVNGGQPVEADLFVSNAVSQSPTKMIRRITEIDGGSS